MSVVRGNPLFRPRSANSSLVLAALEPAFASGKPVGRVYLLAPTSQAKELAEQFGIEHGKDGAFFQLDAGVDLRGIPSRLLPFFARPDVTPFISDLTPANSWGGSLGALMTSTSLQPFIDASDRKFAGHCYMCGTPRPKAGSHNARPWWGYSAPTEGASHGLQYLLALTPMCRDCIDMLHLGKSDLSRADAAVARLAGAFRFSEAEVQTYRDLVSQRWERHSGHMWAVNPSRVFADATMHLQASWDHRTDSAQRQPVVFRPGTSQSQPASLLLQGVKYQLSSAHRVHLYEAAA